MLSKRIKLTKKDIVNYGLCNLLFVILVVILAVSPAWSKTVEYDLTIDYKTVNFTGTDKQAMTVNGQIPGPTLTFTEGDKAIIHVHNKLDEETSVHWHGILLPNQYDGVPYVTTMPILPGNSHTFSFDLRQAGTYWYHSHTNLQEQSGIYGSIVIHPQQEKIHVDHDLVLLLSDWTDEEPYEVLRTLKRGSEWYSIKKGMAQSWDRVIANNAVPDRLKQSFRRMPPMDISDVYYDAFLINGRPVINLDQLKPGETVRLRVINGATSTYFNLQFAGGPLRLISADGLDVQPLEVDRALIAIAETYDFLLSVPADGAYELRATAQDGSGYSSAFIGQGKKILAPDVPKPNLFKMFGMMMSNMDMDMNMKSGGMTDKAGRMPGHGKRHDPGAAAMSGMSEMGGLAMGGEMKKTKGVGVILKDYSLLRSLHSTRLPDTNPVREIRLELTGNMDRYVWSFNNLTLSEADKILIRRGENVRFVLVNKTMMHHPMHLHGHFFRVKNGQGDLAPLKHTVDVAPMQTTVIEFLANEDKDWFFHCHILYHLAAGMARVVRYEGSVIDPALAEAKKKDTFELDDDDFFFWGEVAALTHMNEGSILFSNTRNGVGVEWDSDWEGAYEIGPYYERVLSRLLSVFVGGEFSDEEGEEAEELGLIGVRYILPFYIESELRLDTEGDLRFEAGSEVQLLPRLFFHWFVNTDDEWRYGMELILTKNISLTANHDSDYDAGAGMVVRF